MSEIVMPSGCVACTAEEMEYEGSGFDWQKFGEIAGIVAGVAIAAASATVFFKSGFSASTGELNGLGGAMLGTFIIGLVGTGASICGLVGHEMGRF